MRFRGLYQLQMLVKWARNAFVKGELTASVDWQIEILDGSELAKNFV